MNRLIVGVLTVIIAIYLIPLNLPASLLTTQEERISLYGMLLVLEGLWVIFGPIHYPLLGEQIMKETNESIPSAGSVLVKCCNCGAAYHYEQEKIGPDSTVVCQNCGRTINLQGEADQIL